MELTIVLDIGSTHLWSLDNLKKHIDRAAGLPVMVKAQLFPLGMAGPNCYLPFDLYAKAHEYATSVGVRLFASVFTPELAQQLSELDGRLCKLAAPMRHLINELYDHTSGKPIVRGLFKNWIVSYPLTEAYIGEAPNVSKLLCISEYPTWYRPELRGLDWTAWHGWSSHTFGFGVELDLVNHIEQEGTHREFIIEKHVRLEDRTSCPDATFAVSWDDVRKFVRDVSQTR